MNSTGRADRSASSPASGGVSAFLLHPGGGGGQGVSGAVGPGGSCVSPSGPAGAAAAAGVKQCYGCQGNILDRFLLYALDHYWHTTCLKCSLCQVQLEEVGSSCFTRAGMILCKPDYIKLFGLTGSCSGCGQSIPPNEMVLRVHDSVYHVHCFTCSTCHHRLVAGDRFRFVNGNIVCEQDYVKVMRATNSSSGGNSGSNSLQQQQQQQPTHRTRHKVC